MSQCDSEKLSTCFRSQYGQDKFIFENLLPFKDGTFFEAGALDGETISNTYFFEKAMDWSGILVEMQPGFLPSLTAKRSNARIFRCGLGPENAQLMWFEAGDRSGLLRYLDKGSVEHLEEHYKTTEPKPVFKIGWVEVRPIMEVLADAGCKHIDYFSLDVEGGEMAILQSINFNKVTIDLFTIEDNNGLWFEHRDHLEPLGYTFIGSKDTDGYFLHARLMERLTSQHGAQHLLAAGKLLTPPHPRLES